MAKLTVHVVLDRSGSMMSIKDDTIGSFNSYVETLAKENPKSILSLTTFASDREGIKTVIDSQLITEIEPLTDKTYVPSGGTPLYDAIGHVVSKLSEEKAKNKALVIITDGEENSSREYNNLAIKKLLEEKQKKENWLVIFLGADQDAFAEGAKFGASAATTMTFKKSAGGMTKGFAAAARATSSYADTSLLGSATFTTQERKEAADDE